MKAKAKPAVMANLAEMASPMSFKDAGYKTALIGEGRASVARWVLEQCPDFLEQCPDEVKSDLLAGFQLRAHELWGSVKYRTGDTGILLEDAEGNVELNVHVAMAYTGQAFGKLREENPALHEKVGIWRKKFQQYASNAMADLKGACKKQLNAGKPRERASNKSFDEACKAVFDALEKRVKTAKSRGDDTADPLKFRLAVDAFWKALNG